MDPNLQLEEKKARKNPCKSLVNPFTIVLEGRYGEGDLYIRYHARARRLVLSAIEKGGGKSL